MTAVLRIYTDSNACGLAWSLASIEEEGCLGDFETGAIGDELESNAEAAEALKALWRLIETGTLDRSIDYNDGGCITIKGDLAALRSLLATIA
jgi:hypothetical protein